MTDEIRHIPRLMLAAPSSGQGKTSLCCALLQAALRAGRRPCAFKCGPDYIDPMFHRSVLGVPSQNLDLFFSSPEQVIRLLCQGTQGRDLAVLEGAMGYFDGVGGTDQASSFHLAKVTQTPVVLSVVPKGTALTLAAILQGLRQFRSPDQIKGVILNQCSVKLFSLLKSIIERETGLSVYGYVPNHPEWTIPSRHLGLVTADEVADLHGRMETMAAQLAETVDLPALWALADQAPALHTPADHRPFSQSPGVPIAVAKDRAFSFYYQENLEELRRAGAELIFFSPLEDDCLPEGVCGLYLGGGYPELHARQLNGNEGMRRSIAQAIQDGMPVLAECGGFLYLQKTLQDDQRREWAMVEALSGQGYPVGRLTRFGYVELTAQVDSPYLLTGERIRGHEFHHWDCTENGSLCRAEKPGSGADWDCMVQHKNCLAGFPHLYFGSNPEFAPRFVAQCRQFGGR